jgi:formylglycine-generating enzyme required for sulfatase activity
MSAKNNQDSSVVPFPDQVHMNLKSRKKARLISAMLSAAMFSSLGLTQNISAQDPTGRETPRPPKEAKETPKPVQEDRRQDRRQDGKKTAGRPAKSANSAKPVSRRTPAAKPTPTAARLIIIAPPGAEVEVDGRSRGFASENGNLILNALAPGDHQVRISAEGYEPWSGSFVMSTASTRFEAPMKKKPVTGRLALISTEAGAEILIDEKYGVKTLPGQVTYVDGLLPGVRQLRAVKPGFEEWRGAVTVRINETTSVKVELKPIFDIAMLRIPAGSFIRGNNKGAKDQRPAHEVYTGIYEISRVEVTNRLYKFFIDATGHPAPRGVGYGWTGGNYPEGQGDLPVVFVTWDDAVAFCKWFSTQTGKVYRLPTEAEWEKAAKLGGDQYNSAGKVWEWCLDWYDPDYYKNREQTNPRGAERGKRVKLVGRDGEARVIRGGGFGRGSIVNRAADRNYYFPTMARVDVGFRIVREVVK